MLKLYHTPVLHHRPAGKMGYGVFTRLDFGAGERIFDAPYTEFHYDDIVGTPLWPYAFITDSHFLRIVWGIPSMLNHSDDPNVEIEWKTERRSCVIRTLRDVWRDEQLFMRYRNPQDYPEITQSKDGSPSASTVSSRR